ncbi:MAG: hypothetical protein ACTSWW_01180 [Promethearchaeota archaeon]
MEDSNTPNLKSPVHSINTPQIPDDLPTYQESEDTAQKSTTFTDFLLSFRVPMTKMYIPILITIFAASFLAWMTWKSTIYTEIAGIGTIFPEEETWFQVFLNGFLPVLESAIFVTILWLLIKKFGTGVFKAIMGVMVLFFLWYGWSFFVSIAFTIYWDRLMAINDLLFYIIYLIMSYGSLLFFAFVGLRFFQKKLSITQANAIVLMYSIFIGAIFGIALPTWTMITFALLLSVWDLITVFYGPLGNIARLIQDEQNQQGGHEGGGTHLQDTSDTSEPFGEAQGSFREFMKEVYIEIGSGDLIMYSAFVSHIFIQTLNWFTTGLVIVGIFAGIVLTLYYLIKKRKMVPGLPFSMLFGTIMFFIGQAIVM